MRTYTIPLRRKVRNTERQAKTKRATTEVRAFIKKHMKATEVKIGRQLNEKLWENGIRNPPGKVVVDTELKEGIAYVDLHGVELHSQVLAKKEAEEKQKEAAEKKTSKKKETLEEEVVEEKKVSKKTDASQEAVEEKPASKKKE